MALRQKIRLTILFLILLTFPITLNYFSVYLIIDSSSQGIMAFSFFFWTLFTVTALFFGRAACSYGCPLGAIQETKDRMAPKELKKIKYLKWIKYVLAVAWVGAVAAAAVSAGGYRTIDLLYNTESGVSVDNVWAWITYFAIVLVVLLPVFFIGKRGFCHYFCPWGVLNMTVTKIKNFFRLPSLNLKADSESCQHCGTCADNCPNGVIKYHWGRPASKSE